MRLNSNRYSVCASAVGRPVEIRADAERIEFWQEGRVVGQHARVFGRGNTVYDPWHYVSAPARKPGARRNGAPFKDRVLPSSLKRVRRKLQGAANGDRQQRSHRLMRCASPMNLRWIARATTNPGGPGMERSARHCPRTDGGQWLALEAMGKPKLYGMKAADDEILTMAVKRQHEPQRIIAIFSPPRSAKSRPAPSNTR